VGLDNQGNPPYTVVMGLREASVIEQVEEMRGGRTLRVPELLAKRGWTAIDLIQRPEFLIPPATAYRLARKDEVVRSLGFEILEKLSRGFHVSVTDLWNWEESG
jgi:hypothetical protein